MAFVTLPNSHADGDYALAVEIADRLELEELHVFHIEPREQPPRAEYTSEVGPVAASDGSRGLLAALGAVIDWIGDRLVPSERARA